MAAGASSMPGPVLQKLNALLHREPFETVVYGLYWSCVLLWSAPFAVAYLLISSLVKLWHLVFHGRNHNDYCHPARHTGRNSHHELAVVITGCDSGIGRELVVWAADAGFVVFAGCLTQDSMRELGDIKNVIPLQMDVTKDEDVFKACKKVQNWIGEESAAGAGNDDDARPAPKRKRSLHALINNAGVGIAGAVDWLELSDLQRCMDVNYMGLARVCKAFLTTFKDQAIKGTWEHARIFNVVSMAGMVTGGPGFSAYSASKHAAWVFSEMLRLELSGFGIQVTTVNPSFHWTPLVAKMREEIKGVWDRLPEKTREEYGEAYFEGMCKVSVDLPHRFTWKMDVAIHQMMRHLLARTAPAELLIGSDARFGLPILRMLPAPVTDSLQKIAHRPVPAVMMSKA